MQKNTMKNKSTAANNALPQLGQNIVTSAAARYQLWFGAALVLINFSVISSSYF